MSPTEFRATLAALGLTQGHAARLLGVQRRTVERWACGVTEIPGPVERLLALASSPNSNVRETLESLAGREGV